MNTHIENQPPHARVLRLRVAETFTSRLRGVHASGKLAENEGVLLQPCRAVHTFFLRQQLDIVFLDAEGDERRCIHAMPPFRMAWVKGAHKVVELPAAYCRRHPDYLDRIHAAMRRAQLQSPERNTLT